MITTISIILTVISSLLGATGMLFFKLGSKKATLKIKDWLRNWKIIFGLVLYATALLALIFALKTGDLSVVYPIYALSYVWVALYSKTLLKEKVNLMNWIGTFIIILGIILTTIK